jgi:hypothetical protein
MEESRRGPSKKRPPPDEHADGTTDRPEIPELEGRVPLPEEVTGRASGTDEDLVALMGSDSADHLADGFRGGSGDEESRSGDDGDDTPPHAPEASAEADEP